MSAVLTLENLSIGYTAARQPPLVVAAQLAATLHAGELVCLLGANGVGKSTLLRTLAALQAPLEGAVRLGAESVHHLTLPALARRLSLVLTERVPLGFMRGTHLVALGRQPYTDWSGRLSSADELMVQHAIAAVGGQDIATRPVEQLSDGQRQKLFIARALAQDTPVMLLDEPTAYLDLPRRVEMLRLLRQLAHTTQKAILLSTHDLELALRMADVLWLMVAGGSLYIGAPEDLVLNDRLAQAFHSDGLRFDRQQGTFVVASAPQRYVQLHGTGENRVWTERALLRAGFGVRTDGHLPLIEIQAPHLWVLTWHAQTHAYTSLYSLLRALREDYL
jgi:iron complex transport system ATP-binding protein